MSSSNDQNEKRTTQAARAADDESGHDKVARQQTALAPQPPAATPAELPPTTTAKPVPLGRRRLRKAVTYLSVLVLLAIAGYVLIPMIETALQTVSTDDAYVNGHVTFVAPRVSGQVANVLVDNNDRVKKGDLLVQLDKEPFQVQVEIKKAAVVGAEADLAAANARVRGLVASARANRFSLEHAMEDVRNQVALLKSNAAKLNAEQAALKLAEADYNRYSDLVSTGAVSKQQFDQHQSAYDVAKNRVRAADETVQQTRASLGLPVNHENPLDVPADLEQNFSTVREALSQLVQSAAELGYQPITWQATPKEAVEQFYKQDPEGNLDRIYARLIQRAPAVKQAEARLLEARRDLDQAELDSRYCDIVSEIDGVVTRRNVNPGNNVSIGQSLMAVRSLTEIWIDANFKETQLADLRIGQRARCEVDMYGNRKEFEGRITGFTMGTGQTLELLPPQNATGNFVKIVQRLPVRIELTDYDPDKAPLFVGLSVVPYVYYKDPPTGPNAGAFLRPFAPLPTGQVSPKP